VQSELDIGTVIGGYRIEDRAGRGGMGVVYRATQIALDRQVALKVLTPELADDDSFRERFQRESRLLAATDHPNVITIHEAGEHAGRLFLAMRYVEGTNLGELLLREGRLDLRRASGLVAQVAAALDAAHSRGLVHRDVKPANILIERRDGLEHAYLTDFGLTKAITASEGGLTATGHFVGTVDFIAPEQVAGGPVDARADIYALGCVLFNLLTGRVPFERDSDVSKIFAHVHDPPPSLLEARPGAPKEMDAVVQRALAKDPDDRFPSAGDFGRAAIAAAEGHEPAVQERTVAAGDAAPLDLRDEMAPVDAPAARASSRDGGGRSRRWRALAALATVAVFTAVGVALLVAGGGDEAGDDSQPATDGALEARLTPQRISVAGEPARIAVGESKAWVASASSREVTAISADGAKEEPIRVDGTPGAIAAGADTVLVVLDRGSAIARIDPDENAIVATTASGLMPNGDLEFAEDAFWGVVSDKELARIDAATGRVTETVATPVGLLGRLAYGDGALWATAEIRGRGSVVRIDPATRTVIATVPLSPGAFPEGLAFGEGALWVVDTNRNRLLRIDPTTEAVSDSTRVDTGFSSDDIAVEGGAIWQANFDPGVLRRFDPATGARVADIRIEVERASDLAVGLGSAWVTTPNADEVTRFAYGDDDA
jgi:streptogramin lyase